MILAASKANEEKKDNMKITRTSSYMPYAQCLIAYLKRAARSALQKGLAICKVSVINKVQQTSWKCIGDSSSSPTIHAITTGHGYRILRYLFYISATLGDLLTGSTFRCT